MQDHELVKINDIVKIDDIKKEHVFTDGCGNISFNLAAKIDKHFDLR